MDIQNSRMGGWWQCFVGWFGGMRAGGVAGIQLDGAADGVLMHIAFGVDCEAVGTGAEAVLVGVWTLEDVEEIMKFSHSKRLPIDGWVCSGLSYSPHRVNELVAWLARLEGLCQREMLIVRTSDLNEQQKSRLVDGLKRRGCRLH